MHGLSAASASPSVSVVKPCLDRPPDPRSAAVFVALLAAGVLYAAGSLVQDLTHTSAPVLTWLPVLLLAASLLIGLSFEFVNGFHDTANAVATVIYTHSLRPHTAVMWSGLCNFAGVMASSGAVAFGIVALLPVELLLQIGSGQGFAMVFALLLAAVLWNLGTWWLGLPASSSHTLIGSVIGVGLANSLLHGAQGSSGVDWSQASRAGYALLLSPLVGFTGAALLLGLLRRLVRRPELYEAPRHAGPPPWWIRAVLVLTCTGVSFAHGSNDGQKGMGLIMLILIGTVPTSYALNRGLPVSDSVRLAARAEQGAAVLHQGTSLLPAADTRATLSTYVRQQELHDGVRPALAALTADIAARTKRYGALSAVPASEAAQFRHDLVLSAEALRHVLKDPRFSLAAGDREDLLQLRASLQEATQFIPLWVKVAVAMALGLGTLVGWKRIVVTVGERIGKAHLSYAQGASAEAMTMVTIGAADAFGLPVSTTHVLSSGVAGTMVANGSGLHLGMVRRLLLTWAITLPAAIVLSGTLYAVFSQLF